ncbi:hypothetical protein [Halomonas sp. H5]|uniref:hypothetical protein n=1 Tax=Halomonas sp. H5 TaxID=3423910 RepID=UPI003D365BA0
MPHLDQTRRRPPAGRRFALALLTLALLVMVLLSPTPARANAPQPHPFVADYQLQVSGWPDARVSHRLSRHGDWWESEMRAAIRLASGHERSRFRLDGDALAASAYSSGYRLLGIGGSYRLGHDDLRELPDRQTALIELSRRAANGHCQANPPCTIRFVDHKGREERLDYRPLAPVAQRLPSGETVQATRLEAWNPDKPERRFFFAFHPRLPGLLLDVEYHRDGERQSHLRLDSLEITE